VCIDAEHGRQNDACGTLLARSGGERLDKAVRFSLE
jgi:hypothetical protein